MIVEIENENLLQAIKNDDLELFDKVIDQKKGKLALCFGRFPLLSICYLYKSKNIINKYETQLAKIKNYTVIDEDYCIYDKFKKIAKRVLRLYVLDTRIITPPEMLAVMGEFRYLDRVYNSLFESNQTTEKLNEICKLRYKKELKVEDFGVIFPKQPITAKQKKIFKLVFILALSFMVFFAGLGFSFFSILGLGTQNYPVRIINEKQLSLALDNDENRYYILNNDIVFNGNTLNTFNGNLNGNGHTITIKSNKSIIKTLSGSIENVNFVVDDMDRTIKNNGGILIDSSSGFINNVNITISGKLVEENDNDELIYAGLVGENTGKIENCFVNIDVEYNGNGVGDASFSALVGSNIGEINDCIIKENSKIITDTIDVAGIAVHNEETGKILESENNAIINQTSNNELWNPNTSGIVIANLGLVSNCYNNGKIISITTANTNQISVFGSGIVCTNLGTVEKSKNTAEIEVTSVNSFIYAGGVVAYNNSRKSYLDNNCNFSKIIVNAENEENILIIAGGIVGYTEGAVKDCFANTEFINNSLLNIVFLGGIIGGEYYSGIGVYIDNNYYVKKENITYGIATVRGSDGIWYLGLETDCNGVDSLEILKSKGVYWE